MVGILVIFSRGRRGADVSSGRDAQAYYKATGTLGASVALADVVY